MHTIEENHRNTLRMKKCSFFESCSAPICPLDEFKSDRTSLPGDPPCQARKRQRFKNGADLPNHGLTNSEMAIYTTIYGSKDNAIKQLENKFLNRKKSSNVNAVVDTTEK